MRNSRIIHTAMIAVMLIGAGSIGFAQQDDKHENKDKQDQHQQQANDRAQQDRGQRQHEQMQQPARGDHRQAEQAQQRQRRDDTRGQWNDYRRQRGEGQQQRARNFDRQHRSWEQRGGYDGYRIPERQFNRRFGRGHSFHMSSALYSGYGGQSRFRYGGYWLELMEPYPEYWGSDWEHNDDMYVGYDNGGYYLYNRRYPGRPGVTLSITF
ncbi:MAG: hypothetical protein KGN79_05100 [Acidobacteriota bacterium]|nr:hypothetical protein [Acidobacteriota bacterium]